MRVSRIMLQSLTREPMTPTSMRHIYKQHPPGYACAVCGGLATTEEGISHFRANPVTDPIPPTSTVHLEEACPITAQQGAPVAVPATPTVDDTARAMPVTGEPLTGQRQQNLTQLGATRRDTPRTLRDMFEPMGRLGLDAQQVAQGHTALPISQLPHRTAHP
jgi:hypothetical protein